MNWGMLSSPDFLVAAGNKALRLLAIGLITWLACWFFGLVVDRFFTPRPGRLMILDEKRALTLSSLLKSILRYSVYFAAVIMILQEFKIDTTSILAGAGVIGLAIGVGAQGLVKDFITGFFIILEDQYSVGDYIVCDSMAGTVEEIGFRVTKLRDANGAMHIIPNSSISRISNYTRGRMQAVINLPLAADVDIEKAISVLKEVCSEVAEMQEILEGPSVFGVVDIKPGEVVVRVTARTLPLEQAKVETAFRLKAIARLDSAGIALALSRPAKGEGGPA